MFAVTISAGCQTLPGYKVTSSVECWSVYSATASTPSPSNTYVLQTPSIAIAHFSWASYNHSKCKASVSLPCNKKDLKDNPGRKVTGFVQN